MGCGLGPHRPCRKPARGRVSFLVSGCGEEVLELARREEGGGGRDPHVLPSSVLAASPVPASTYEVECIRSVCFLFFFVFYVFCIKRAFVFLFRLYCIHSDFLCQNS